MVGRDLTARRATEEALRNSENRFRTIVQNADAVIFVLDREGRFELSEGRGLAALGLQSGELVGRSAFDLYRDNADILPALHEALAGRTAKRIVRVGPLVFDTFVTPRLDSARTVTGVIGLANNITARVRAEEALHAANENLERSVRERTAELVEANRLLDQTGEIARVGGWELDLRTAEINWTGATREIHDLDPDFRPTLDTGVSFYAPEAQPLIAAAVQRTTTTGEPFDLELPFITAKGRHLWVRSIGHAYWNSGVIVKLGGVFQDITERRHAEDELRRHRDHLEELVTSRTAEVGASEERFRRAVIAAPFPILLHAEDGAIVQANDTWCSITGYTREELHTIADWTARAYGATAPDLNAYIDGLYALDGPRYEGDYRIRTRTGATRIWELSSAPLGRLPDGRRLVISMALDVTERRRAEDEVRTFAAELENRVHDRTQELSTANERLRELDRLKSEFLSTMSHELRTPLNSIVGFTGILLKELSGPLNPEQVKQLGLVQSSARHLLALINDLLDLSRIESGRIELHPEPFDFAGVIAEVVAFLTPVAHQKALVLRSDCVPGPQPLVGDRRRILQVLLNLVTNAVKFTERGEVVITARVATCQLVVAVRDTGIGIRLDQLPHLFEAFRQLDATAHRHYEGTGLGLHLCRKLLDLLGGAITVESAAGVGSTFTFTLPLAGAPAP
ncbi:MAG: PAS domain S-box protein [Opitutaceae bacterium]|nr:PAS domain S-box protein [Opitutaceae bacterium]